MNQDPTTGISTGEPTPPADRPVSALPKKPIRVYTKGEVILAVALWVMGYLACAVLPAMEYPIPAFVLQAVLFPGVVILLGRRSVGGQVSAQGIFFLVTSLALSFSLLFTTNRAIVNCAVIWNTLAWFYLVFLLTGNARRRFPGASFVGEFLGATVVMPFRASGSLFGAIFGSGKNPDGTPRRRAKVGAVIGWAALGLFCAIIPTLIIVLLLSYDDGFTDILDNILEEIFSNDTLFRQIRSIGFGLLVGALMFGAVLAGRQKKGSKPEPDAETAAKRADLVHVIPVPLVAAMLTPILAIYVIFFISQWDYYVSAFTGVRPEELTFSDYAREGFFQLVAVAVINALLGLGAAIFSRRRAFDPARPRRERLSIVMRIYLSILSLSTLVLIATALSKMFLYIDTYGMTHKRTYATWLMVLMAVGFLSVILRQLWTRMNLTGTLLVAFLAFFIAISVVNVDSLIVRYNVNAALGGNLRTMQGDVCEDSGYAGVLAALDFMEASADPAAVPYDPEEFKPETLESIRKTTNAYLQEMTDRLEAMDWHEHNVVTLRARAALREAGYTPTPDEAEDTDKSDLPDDNESADTTPAGE